MNRYTWSRIPTPLGAINATVIGGTLAEATDALIDSVLECLPTDWGVAEADQFVHAISIHPVQVEELSELQVRWEFHE